MKQLLIAITILLLCSCVDMKDATSDASTRYHNTIAIYQLTLSAPKYTVLVETTSGWYKCWYNSENLSDSRLPPHCYPISDGSATDLLKIEHGMEEQACK